VEAEVHKRMGNFILAEDSDTLEGNILTHMVAERITLATVENFTGGQIAGRLAPQPGADLFFLRGTVARGETNLASAVGLQGRGEHWGDLERFAGDLAEAARRQAGATLGLCVLCAVDDQQPKEANQTGQIAIAIASSQGVATRGSKLAGHRDWIRLGAVEMGLDSLRRFLKGLPLHERTDFERRPA
ncbi:MAG TPA: CinA family protein, partial [bacterium]